MLKERQMQIARYLADRGTYATLAEIADAFQVSPRTVRTDLDAIESELAGRKVKLDRRPKAGIRMLIEEGVTLEEAMREPGLRDPGRQERAWRILLYTALYGQSTIDELAEELLVSRNTVVSDLKLAEEIAAEGGASLTGKSYVGTRLEGNEGVIRRLLYNIHIQWLRHADMGILETGLSRAEVSLEEIRDLIGYVEEESGLRFSDQSVRELEGGLMIALHRMQMGWNINQEGQQEPHLVSQQKDKAAEDEAETRVLSALRKYFRTVSGIVPSDGDLQYLDVLFRGAGVVSGGESRRRGGKIAPLCREFLQEYAQIVKIPVDPEDALEEKFLVHLQIAVHRLRSGIRIGSSVFPDMRYASSFLYEIADSLLKRYEPRFEVIFPEEETAYVAMYFEVLFQRTVLTQEDLKIVIVCHGGVATSSLLRQRLAVILPQVRVQAILRVGDLEKELPRLRPDLVVTSLSLRLPGYRVIRVSPVLNPEDVQKISAAVSEMVYMRQNDVLIRRVEWGSMRSLGLLLLPQFCRFGAKIRDWREAVRTASAPLLSDGRIEEEYIGEMIRVVQEMGNYMIFIPEIAFVHAKPQHVKRTGIAVLNLAERIDFGTRNVSKVKVIVVVANHEENTLLADLIRLLLRGDNLRIFKEASSYEALWEMEGKEDDS